MKPEDFTSERAPQAVGAFPHAKRVGSWLYLSGIGPRQRGTSAIPGVTLDEDGKIIDYDIKAQCAAVFQNVRTVLEDAGADFNDIVDVQVYLTNMKDDFLEFNEMYAATFAGEGRPNPTRTTVEINCLPTPIAVELKVIAHLRS